MESSWAVGFEDGYHGRKRDPGIHNRERYFAGYADGVGEWWSEIYEEHSKRSSNGK